VGWEVRGEEGGRDGLFVGRARTGWGRWGVCVTSMSSSSSSSSSSRSNRRKREVVVEEKEEERCSVSGGREGEREGGRAFLQVVEGGREEEPFCQERSFCNMHMQSIGRVVFVP